MQEVNMTLVNVNLPETMVVGTQIEKENKITKLIKWVRLAMK